MTLDGVSACNIINFDETNLTDDPGRKKCVYRRGCKYPEHVVNSTKASTSIMFAGTSGRIIIRIWCTRLNTCMIGGKKVAHLTSDTTAQDQTGLTMCVDRRWPTSRPIQQNKPVLTMCLSPIGSSQLLFHLVVTL